MSRPRVMPFFPEPSRLVARRYRVLALAAGVAIVVSPAMARAQDGVRVTPPYEPPRPFVRFSQTALALRDSIVSLARMQLGTRYIRGGESPERGFDCSGLIRYIVASLNLPLPRTAAQQAHAGDAVPADTSLLLPGDILTFGRGHTISHVGIYVGNGRMIHASTKARRVIETNVVRAPYRGIKPWRGARRIVVEDAVADSTG